MKHCVEYDGDEAQTFLLCPGMMSRSMTPVVFFLAPTELLMT